MPGLSLVTAPASEPVTLSEAKLFAKISGTADDALVTDLIAGARKLCENHLGWSFINQTWDLFLDAFPGQLIQFQVPSESFTPFPGQQWTGQGYWAGWPILLPRGPVSAVSFVKYTDYQGNLLTVSSSDYNTDLTLGADGFPDMARIVPAVNKTWPTAQLQALNGVQVEYVAGFGAAAANVPENIRAAIKQLISLWYRNRDSIGCMPEHVANILTGTVNGFAYA